MDHNLHEHENLKPVHNTDFLNCPITLKKIDNISIGRGIRGLRKEFNISQNMLAMMSCINQNHLSNVENGKHSISHHKLSSICRSLNIPMDELISKSTIEYQSLIESADLFIFEDGFGGYYFDEESLIEQSDKWVQ